MIMSYNAIGGYFELADRCEQEMPIPVDGIMLNTCRNAIEYILRHTTDCTHVFLPYYTCDSVLEPLIKLGIAYDFYHINERLEQSEELNLQDGEYIIANNYFGIQDKYISLQAERYKHRLIVDNAQAFFAPVADGVKAVYSPRKYVGVADGGIAVGVYGYLTSYYETDNAQDHNSHLLTRKLYGAEAGFAQYQTNEQKLANLPIRRMSAETIDILQHINYDEIIRIRRQNFEYLHAALSECNEIDIPTLNSFSCPMVYPFMVKEGAVLRKKLIEHKVFVARYWPNVLEWTKEQDLEYRITDNLLPLPVDQRYGKEDMDRIISVIYESTNKTFTGK